ncbi:hypothetical protein [Paenibacillus luteus]|uniref:hypothetical protein n=1 Tax=Paenibacillus luteus TaxID=2545753 RepID=UPI0019D65AA2|nr:hypothetical protein [Paenibacillus luteus]
MKQRKVRSDKKRAIAPYIPDIERVWIQRIANRCALPEGEVGIQLVKTALLDEDCIVFFSSYFKRDFRFTENITYCGHKEYRSIYEYINDDSERDRFKLKASQTLYDQLCEFQIGLGVSFLAHATYALLRYALHDLKTIQKVAPGMLKEDFTGPMKPVTALLQPSKAWSILE